MAISFVASSTGSAANGGNITLAMPTGVAEGDLVVVTHTIGAAGDFAMATSSSGWTKQDEQFQAATNATNHAVYTKIMGAAPDTSIVLTGNGAAASGCSAVAEAFRGVDTTTPLDVAVASAKGTGTGQPNPAAITPVTSGAVIVACGSAAAAAGALFTNPGSYNSGAGEFQSATQADGVDAMTGMGFYAWSGSGASDPAQFTGGTTGANDSWAATTLALRPASAPAQTLTAPLLSNAQTFYAPTVTQVTTLSPPLIASAGSLFAPTVSVGPVTLSPPLIASANAFYSPTLTLTLAPPLIAASGSLFAPAVSSIVTLSPPLIASAGTLYAPTIIQDAVLSPPLIASGSSLFAPTVSYPQTLYPPLLTNGGGQTGCRVMIATI